MKELRISTNFNLHAKTTEDVSEYIRQGLQFSKDMGFSAVNFGLEDINLINLNADGWQQTIETATAAADEIGIRFELCHLPFTTEKPLRDPAFAEQFDKKMHTAIEAAHLLGSDFAVLHPSTSNYNLTAFNRRQQYDMVMKHLTPYVEHAARLGVTVVVENMRVSNGARLSHRYCQDPDELCDIADALGIGVCWDFGHANISGLRQSESLEYVGKRLKVLHVNDNSGIDDDHIAPFMGTIDWKDAMHGLALTGFDGLFNYEVAARKLPKVTRSAYAQYLMDAAHELLSYIE